MVYRLLENERGYLELLKERYRTNLNEVEDQREEKDDPNLYELTQLKEENYKKFFRQMMKSWNIDSIEDLSDEKKKKFFNAVDKAWKSDKEKSK